MRFQTAFNWMKKGKKLTCSGFLGYWLWDKELREVIIITKNNETIPMKESDDWDFTLGFINSDEWEFYNGPEDPRESDEYKQVAVENKTSRYRMYPVVRPETSRFFSERVIARTITDDTGNKFLSAPIKVNMGEDFNLIGLSNIHLLDSGLDIDSSFFLHSRSMKLAKINLVVDGELTPLTVGDVPDALGVVSEVSNVSFIDYTDDTFSIMFGDMHIDLSVNITTAIDIGTGRAHIAGNVVPGRGSEVINERITNAVKERVIVDSVELEMFLEKT